MMRGIRGDIPGRITAAWLDEAGCCEEQYELFGATFPGGCAIGVPAIRRAKEVGLNLDWIAERCLTPEAWDRYDEAVGPVRMARDPALDEAWKAFARATEAAWVAYQVAHAVRGEGPAPEADVDWAAYMAAYDDAERRYLDVAAFLDRTLNAAAERALLAVLFPDVEDAA